jgi:hypothetical protein
VASVGEITAILISGEKISPHFKDSPVFFFLLTEK